MRTFLNMLTASMSDEERERLQAVYAPRIVATQPSNAWMDMCVLPNGEIRHYGYRGKQRVYIASKDGGLSWKEYDVSDKTAMCSGYQLPWSGRWILSYAIAGEGGFQGAQMPTPPKGSSGWMAAVSEEGPGGKVRWVKISDENVVCPRFPLALRARQRVIIMAQTAEYPKHPVAAWSDDSGETWKTVHLESAPYHAITWPHKGYRWQNGACETTIAERSDGSLYMLARTSQDFHYQYESFDGGETWTKPVPSIFHGTLTMPTLLRMEDGRILTFFCNTQPLPELDKTAIFPPMNAGEISGMGGEDVFTNRDANHAALSSDDGKTWRGFRELFLNPIRNTCDFRTSGGSEALDKSVHQFQAIELPFGKVLLAFGQHPLSRRLLVFDPNWLLETSRQEDFAMGMTNVSTQVYLKSVSGNIRTRSGHCAWNRTDGALLMPDPDSNYEEAVFIRANPDPLLFTSKQGVVWNFPATHHGRVDIQLRTAGEGVQITLSDRWLNPCDGLAGAQSAYTYAVEDTKELQTGWHILTLTWDAQRCIIKMDGKRCLEMSASQAYPYGLCYLLIQSQDAPRCGGAYIKKLAMREADL
uniref:exo-alpha-sialidase n=1 Tax=uncultured bacterium fosmid pJB148G3 TaxID=1478052 RepID=A0A0H3UAW3_9BACT|nr:hypothetical protein [uncultured bacterium fosmid pJB148G3]